MQSERVRTALIIVSVIVFCQVSGVVAGIITHGTSDADVIAVGEYSILRSVLNVICELAIICAVLSISKRAKPLCTLIIIAAIINGFIGGYTLCSTENLIARAIGVIIPRLVIMTVFTMCATFTTLQNFTSARQSDDMFTFRICLISVMIGIIICGVAVPLLYNAVIH